MNGPHDLGGMHGFGPVPIHHGPAFGQPWEPRVLALMALLLDRGAFNIDAFRHSVERLGHARYFGSSYYQRWLQAVRQLALEHGLASESELDGRERVLRGEPAAASAPKPVELGHPPPAGFARPGAATARFAAGQSVRARNLQPRGHTRLPAYIRGHTGTIARVYGPFVFPDTHAHGLGENPQTLYNVAFDARELWGAEAEARSSVSIDLFESYLEPAAPRDQR